jgi:hypothetical protein
MTDEKRIKVDEFLSISVDDWKNIQQQLKEFPEESGAYIVANDTNCFIDYSEIVRVLTAKLERSGLGPLPGKEGE